VNELKEKNMFRATAGSGIVNVKLTDDMNRPEMIEKLILGIIEEHGALAGLVSVYTVISDIEKLKLTNQARTILGDSAQAGREVHTFVHSWSAEQWKI